MSTTARGSSGWWRRVTPPRAEPSGWGSATTAEAANVLVLPRRVISDVHDGSGIVWVVEKGHAPARRTVGVGISDGHVMEITSGLQAGERGLVTAASPPPGSRSEER